MESLKLWRKVGIGISFFLILTASFVAQINHLLYKDEVYESIFGLEKFAFYISSRPVAIISSVLFVILTLITIQKKPEKPRWNYYFATGWFLLNLMIIIAGISHNIGDGYVITQITIMICIPVLAMTLSGDDRLAEFFDIIAWAAVAFFVALTLINMIGFPYGMLTDKSWSLLMTNEGRYLGITNHHNRLAEFAAIAIICSTSFLKLIKLANKRSSSSSNDAMSPATVSLRPLSVLM